MGFAPQAYINHAAIRHNLQRVREVAADSQIWAVVKANAYGHGLERVAQILKDVDGFAVARIDEALRLRQLGIERPLLIMEGVFTQSDVFAAAAADCQFTLHHRQQIDLLEQVNLQRPLKIWLKVDTGMHRLGFRPEEIDGIAERLNHCQAVAELNLMTHLANADDRQDQATQWQCRIFNQLPLGRFSQLTIANSAGLLAYPETRLDWVRPGIMLYGVSPFIDSVGSDEGLMPVMSFCSPVIAVNHCRAGETIGYGGSYRCPHDMPVAVIGVGYGDGYPRHARVGTPVLLRQQRLPLIGRVSMDMICVDASRIPDLEVGEEAILWGDDLVVEEIAQAAGTIAYELLCGITGRVEFVDRYTQQET